MKYLLPLVLLVACGPTGQVKVERHLVCAADGTNCQTIESAQQEYTATDRFWQIFLALLLR
jgi:hypothetical protein